MNCDVLSDYFRVPHPEDCAESGAALRACEFPTELVDKIDFIRRERYTASPLSGSPRFVDRIAVRKAYYLLRSLLPTGVRRRMQRAYLSDWRQLTFPNWPVDFTVDNFHQDLLRSAMLENGLTRIPFIWFWPNGAPSCLILTHDVETIVGRKFSSSLMAMDSERGFRASFQVVPEERYEVPPEYVCEIRTRGFEFNVHDLNHDGRLFRERAHFLSRAEKINAYCSQYEADGFRAGAMYHNADWYDAFTFSYDMSVSNVAHLEPQRGGCCTVMPYFIGRILELPLTTVQDYSLFHMLETYSLDLWKQQIDLIHRRNGLISFICHPDYLIESRSRKCYEGLLDYLREFADRHKLWSPLPGEVNCWWRLRSKMNLVFRDRRWVVDGPESERASVAYATLDTQGVLRYELAATSRPSILRR